MQDGNSKISSSSQKRRDYILFTIATFAAFAVYGLYGHVKGAALPRIQDELDITELQLGLLLAVNAFGYLITCTFTAAIAKIISIKNCMIAALVLVCISGVFISMSKSFPALLAAYFVTSLGNGMLEVSLSIITATTFKKNTGRMMNFAHFFYGLGAIFGPVLSAGLMTARIGGEALGWRRMYLVVFSLALIPAIPAILGRMEKRAQSEVKARYSAILRNPTMWLIVAIFTFGSICEMGVGSWFVNFLEKAYQYTTEEAAFRLTLFFVCFTAARLILGPLIEKIGYLNATVLGTAFCGVMITVGVLTGEKGTVLLIIAGVGVAPVYPTMMAVMAKLFADDIDHVMTAVLTITGAILIAGDFMLGGIVYLSRQIFTGIYGEAGVGRAYSTGYLFLGLCCFIACAFTIVLRSKQKKAGRLV